MAGEPVCKRCLLRDVAAEAFRSMFDYIESLDEQIKTPKVLYLNRLEVCRECEKLQNAMCIGCGCFVEMRAAVTKNSCPYEKW